MSQLADEKKGFAFRVAIAAIGLNICTAQDFAKVAEQVMGVLLQACDFDPLTVLLSLVPDMDKEEETLPYQAWKNRCEAQRMSFELLTNISSTLAFPHGHEDAMADFDDENEDLAADENSHVVLESTRLEFIQFVAKSGIIVKLFDSFLKLSKQPNPLIVASAKAANELPIVNQSLLRCLNCLNNVIMASPVASTYFFLLLSPIQRVNTNYT